MEQNQNPELKLTASSGRVASMRLPALPLILTTVVITALLLAGAWLLLNPGNGPALTQASFSLAAISPNADGNQDVTRISYTLRRPANVSIYFLNAQEQRFDFRADQPRDAGQHQVDFSGIVAPYTLPGDNYSATLLARVLQNGDYTWVIEAHDQAGAASGKLTGPLTIAEADTALPDLRNFTANPSVFTPNQDGLNDRTQINIWLDKDVADSGLRVDLINSTGVDLPIAEKVATIKHGERGLHQYDYDGGIDLGQNPPPNGVYTVTGTVEDRLGQKMAVTTPLTIVDGGLPRAEILNGEVKLSATTLTLGQTLYFTLTVENYGNSPIRTSGPPSGTIYKSMAENANSLGYYDQSGVFRVGLMCQTCKSDFPWRWALGMSDTLSKTVDENGNTQYYLLPGQRATITGGVVLDEIVTSRNPQNFWGGLIHEDVAMVNNGVDPQAITIVPNK
jgi:hypothetical protein